MSQWRASKLLGQKLVSGRSVDQPDKLLHLLVNADNGSVLAWVGHRVVLAPEKITSSPTPLTLWGRVLQADEKENINRALKNRQFILKTKVETESGHYLGRAIDFEFDDISWKLQRLFISDRVFFRALAEQLQIPKDDILFIGKDKIIVRDGLVKKENLARASQPNTEYVGADSGATLSKES